MVKHLSLVLAGLSAFVACVNRDYNTDSQGLNARTSQSEASLPGSATSELLCLQEEGDNRYDVKTTKDVLAIVHTNDSDVSKSIYFDSYEYYGNNGVISAGRYIIEFAKPGKSFSSLYQKEGTKKVLLTDTLVCSEDRSDISKWVLSKEKP
jgi:hypothetical protein